MTIERGRICYFASVGPDSAILELEAIIKKNLQKNEFIKDNCPNLHNFFEQLASTFSTKNRNIGIKQKIINYITKIRDNEVILFNKFFTDDEIISYFEKFVEQKINKIQENNENFIGGAKNSYKIQLDTITKRKFIFKGNRRWFLDKHLGKYRYSDKTKTYIYLLK